MKNSEHDFALPPFPAFPSVSRYVPVGPVAETVSRVARSVLAKEAISLVIGPPGTGKSLVCALLAQQFLESHDVALLGETALEDSNSFLRALIHRLGVPIETHTPNDLRLLIEERLTGPDANPNGLLLLIDEAASLSEDVLESIRRVTNVMKDGQPAVSAVLAGGIALDELLTNPRLEPLVQRVSARCYLHPLNIEESRAYIRECIESCGSSPEETITEKAISAIHHASNGVARLINQMMTEVIDCAAELGESLIDEHTVDKAWAQLQQLPSPMVQEPELNHQPSTVEFGELSDVETQEHTSQPHEPMLSVSEPLVAEPGMIESAMREFKISNEAATQPVELTPDEILNPVGQGSGSLSNVSDSPVPFEPRQSHKRGSRRSVWPFRQ